MSSNIPTGRKKPRAKESKPPIGSRLDRSRSSFQSSSFILDDAGGTMLSDAPYVCTGRFGLDFVQLCRRAHMTYVPSVVARTHRPSAAPVEEKKSIVRKTAPKIIPIPVHAAVSDQPMAADGAEVFIPEPPPKTYVLRDHAAFFRPSVQV